MTLLTNWYISSTRKCLNFGRIFIKVVKCKLSIYNAFYFSGQFYEKWMSVRERNINLLLEAVTYMATTETATCIITIEIVMCIMHCRKYHLHDCNRGSTCKIPIKIFTHIFAAEIFTGISGAETSNCIIATETVSPS